MLCSIRSMLIVLTLGLNVGCATLPPAPKTRLCLFVNTYMTGMPTSDPSPVMDKTFKTIAKNVKENPSLINLKQPKIMPPELHFFRCRNASSTKFNISVTSESATDMVATPIYDFLELNNYYNKLADVFTKELRKVAQ